MGIRNIGGPFENLVDWRQLAAVVKREAQQHNSGALPPVHELFKQHS
jgi:hypothetical protein